VHFMPTMEHLKSCPGHIVLGQEINDNMGRLMKDAGWILSEERYLGSDRANGNMQLMVAAWPTVCTAVQVVRDGTFSFNPRQDGGPPRCSHVLTADVRFRWQVGSMNSLTVTTLHLHRGAAALTRRSEAWLSGARLIGGDANKALFSLAESLERDEGIQVELVARHCGLDVYGHIAAFDQRALKAAIRHDSMGIWVIGSRGPCRPLTLGTRCIVSALHPDQRDSQVAQAVRRQERLARDLDQQRLEQAPEARQDAEAR